MDGPRGLATVPWRFAARLLRSGRAPRLRRPGRDWDQAGRAGAAPAKAGAACYRQNAAGKAAAPTQPLWVTTDIEPRALGAARACCRGQFPDLDRRQSVAPGRVSGVREDKPASEV